MNEAIQFLIRHGYSTLFLWVFVNQIGIPIPVTPILLVAGALAGLGKLSFYLVLTVSFFASLLSDLFLYLIGRLRGSRVLSLLCQISFDPDSCVRRTKSIFGKYGARSFLIIKFLPAMNTVGAPLAGIFHMHPLRFFLFDGLGAFFWAAVFSGFGYLFTYEIEYFAAHATRHASWIVGMIPILFAGYILSKYIQRTRILHQLAGARITPEEVKERLDAGEDLLILDVRHTFEFKREPYTIPGAFQLPIEELEENHHKIPRGRDIVLFCT